MKAISLWEPWATAIALGLKTMETRSWATSYRGPIAIHAAKMQRDPVQDWDIAAYWEEMCASDRAAFAQAGYHSWESLPFGCVVATAVLATCERTLDVRPSEDEHRWGNYGDGRFAWCLTDIKRRENPSRARGFQRLWEWRCPEAR